MARGGGEGAGATVTPLFLRELAHLFFVEALASAHVWQPDPDETRRLADVSGALHARAGMPEPTESETDVFAPLRRRTG